MLMNRARIETKTRSRRRSSAVGQGASAGSLTALMPPLAGDTGPPAWGDGSCQPHALNEPVATNDTAAGGASGSLNVRQAAVVVVIAMSALDVLGSRALAGAQTVVVVVVLRILALLAVAA